MLDAIWQVVRFESRRTRTVSRVATWLTVAVLPSLLMVALQFQALRPLPQEALGLMTFYLVVQVGCMLGLLLWATPVVGSELEAQTWIYVALRPHGKTAIVLGKYLVAGAWTASAGLVSAAGITWCSRYPDGLKLMTALMILVLISSFCYAALYVLIGVLFTARGTVVAVVYTLLFEGVFSTIPATINKFTVCYRLRALLAEWVNLVDLRTATERFFGYEPPWQHLTHLGIYTLIVLAIAVAVVRKKEFPVNTDG